MNTPIRVLFYGDGIVKTGFSRVSTEILTRLAGMRNRSNTPTFDIHHVAINYTPQRFRKQAQNPTAAQHIEAQLQRFQLEAQRLPYTIYPTDSDKPFEWNREYIEDVYGVTPLLNSLEVVKPDIIVLFNDIWLISKIIPKIQQHQWWRKHHPNIIAYFPVDGYLFKQEVKEPLQSIKASATFTKFGATQLHDLGIDCQIIGHGVNKNQFYPIHSNRLESIKIARHTFRNQVNSGASDWFQGDKFIILQGNRNQYRKMYSKTIEGFVKFLIENDMPKNVGLLLLGIPEDPMGIDWRKLVTFYADFYHVPEQELSSRIRLLRAGGFEDEELNLIYNICDVGINTSKGGGFELVTLEHAATKAAQLVPDNSCFTELWQSKSYMIACEELDVYEYQTPVAFRRVKTESVAQALTKAYTDYKDVTPYLDQCALAYQESQLHDWNEVAKAFESFIQNNV